MSGIKGKNYLKRDVINKSNFLISIQFLVPVLVFIVLLSYVFEFKIDDAFITMRYAQNLCGGYGPVFNSTEGVRVEGYTNFSLVLIEALLLCLGLDDLLFIKIFLGVCGVFTILAIEYFGWLMHQSVFGSFIGGLLVATSSPFIIWTAGGLETTLFTLLVTIGLILEIMRFRGGLGDLGFWAIGITFFLVILTRPDGLIFYACVVLFDFLYSIQKSNYSGLLRNLAGFGIPTIVYLTWKMYYYGRVLPAAFYAKVPTVNSSDSLFELFMGGMKKLGSFLVVDLNVLIVITILIGVFILYHKQKKEVFRFELTFVLFTAFLYMIYLSSLGYRVSMDDAYRFYVPLIPILTIALMLISKPFVSTFNQTHFIIGFLILGITTVRGIDLWWLWNRDLNFGYYNYCLSGENIANGLDTGHISV